MSDWDFSMDEESLRVEKNKARVLRQSQWWKNQRAHNRCYYCGKPFPAKELTMDHIVPLSRGGRSIKSNLVPCCKSCNTEKKNLVPSEWESYLNSIRAQQPLSN